MALHLEIDKQSCQSSGRCVAAAPAAFRLDGDHLGDVLPPGERALPDPERLTIAAACPAAAIRVLDAAGNEIDPGGID